MVKIKRLCAYCNEAFQTTEFRIKDGRGKFCSRACSDRNRLGNRTWTGKKHSEESKKKMSEAHKGIIAGMKGKRHTEESKKKMSDALKGKTSGMKGKHHSEQTRQKMIGRRLSEESKRKIREAKKGSMPWNKGVKGLLSPMKGKKTGKPAWNRGVSPSPETLKRLSDSHKGQDHWTGRVHSKESLKKMSEGHKLNPTRYWLGKSRPDIAESSRKHILKLYESGSFPRQTNTLPERQLKEELLLHGYQEGIDFIHQFKFYEKFMCDFAFPKEKVIVECDGDYWHVNPGSKYAKNAPNSAQKRSLRIDKSKEAYIRKADNGSWCLLRFWESDIKKDVKSCVKKIEEALTSKKHPTG